MAAVPFGIKSGKTVAMEFFQLADAVPSSRGSKTCRLHDIDGEDVVYMTTGAAGMTAPFGATSFDTASTTKRKRFDIRLEDEETLKFFNSLNAWAVEYITNNSQRLFGRVLSREEVELQYLPCARKKSSHHMPMLYTKFWADGRGALRCWDEAGAPRELPTRWRHTWLHLRLHVSHLWIMGKDCGFVTECTDIRVLREEPESMALACPWQELSPLGPFTDVDGLDEQKDKLYNECWPNERKV